MLRCVAVTRYRGISAFGCGRQAVEAGLQACENKVIRMANWLRYDELNTKLAVPVLNYTPPSH